MASGVGSDDPLQDLIPASIGPEVADEGSALLLTAIGELSETTSADALIRREGELSVMVLKAERLERFGVDVAALARAIQVLSRRREPTD